MNEERTAVLRMLSEGKITVEEAEKLLEVLTQARPASIQDAKARASGRERASTSIPLNMKAVFNS